MAVNQEQVMDMLCSAIELAEKGKALYGKALQSCENDLSKEIFGILRDEEAEHEQKIREVYDSLRTGTQAEQAWSRCKVDTERTRPLFHGIAEKYGPAKACMSELQALDMALELEDKCVKFYEKELEHDLGSQAQQFVKYLLMDEREHRRMIADVQFYFNDPEGWFIDKEHPHIDGA